MPDVALLARALVTAAAVVTALGIICRTRPVRWIGRTLISQPVLGAFEERVGRVIRPVDEKVDRLTEQVAAIDAELHPNHGGSLRDAVDRVVDQTAP